MGERRELEGRGRPCPQRDGSSKFEPKLIFWRDRVELSMSRYERTRRRSFSFPFGAFRVQNSAPLSVLCFGRRRKNKVPFPRSWQARSSARTNERSVEQCNNARAKRVRIVFCDRVWRDQPRGKTKGGAAPEVFSLRFIPTHEVGKTL